MHEDIKCPYCEHPQDIDHDGGSYGFEEDVAHEQECDQCEKTFVYTTSVSYYYDVRKADCLNGSAHTMEPVTHYPSHWPDWKRCADCAHEDKGAQFVSSSELGLK